MNESGAGNTAPRWQPSLRAYLILMNVVLLCLLFPTISIFYFQKFSTFRDDQLDRVVSDRTAELRRKATQQVRSISHSGTQAIAEYNYTFLYDLVKKAVLNDPEFIGCQFVSKTAPDVETASYGYLGTDQEDYSSFLGHSASPDHFPDQVSDVEQLHVVYFDVKQDHESGIGNTVLIATAPVYVGGTLWGTVNASFSMELLNSDLANIRNEWARLMRHYKSSFLTMTIIFVVVGVVSAIILTRPLLRSIDLLQVGVDKVSRGDLEHEIYLSGLTCNEFFELSHSFNDMTASLREAKKQLDDYSHSLEEQVTERTRELKETQDELLAQAHEAGMAEMAVGVLHNIGNAITPVKVGTTAIQKQMHESPLRTNLDDVLGKLPEAIHSYPEFSAEEKEKLTKILKILPESIREEYDRIIVELELISEKHKYIENIISLQMHYARLKGQSELVDVNRVAGDALEMLADVTTKEEIDVETSFQAESMVRLEESKLLQIMINLVKNSCEALSTTDEGRKKIVVSTSQRNGGIPEVVLSVKDTGCGFTPEEEKHFFSFGFSTKKRGSGFGLHSCANYLIANNGTIEAKSRGQGKGAEFIIRLPAVQVTT